MQTTPQLLDARKQLILKALVYDYTETAVPVGSHALAAHLSAWSPATIRNELASLVDIGYLIQPHPSAGRVPSELGYRYYVDFLMDEEEMSPQVRRQVDPFPGARPLFLEEVLEAAAMVLALATDAISIVTGPAGVTGRVKHVDLVSLGGPEALLVVVLDGNEVRRAPLRLRRPADQEELSRVARELDLELRGRAPGPAEDAMVGDLREEVRAALAAFVRHLAESPRPLILHDGIRNLLRQPEFEDIESLGGVLEVVEEGSRLVEAIASSDLARGIHVMIGHESGIAELSRCSLVLSGYRVGPDRCGSVGVLGPTRMRYPQVAARVRFVADRVGWALAPILN